MKSASKVRNIFLIIGIVAIVVMLFTFEVPYREIWENLQKAGWWFVAVLAIWIPIYMLNAWAWIVILNDGSHSNVNFWRILKYTVSGYAINYVTPIGVLGGEPYRIMELTPHVGGAKATSSVILYAMMHIYSHFFFWAFSVLLYIALYFSKIDVMMGLLLLLVSAFCAIAIYFFMKGYRNGLAQKTLRILSRIPGMKKWATRISVEKKEELERIDSQIAELHKKRKSTFYLSLFLEFMARVVGCLEIWFIMMIFTDSVSFFDCILISAFTTLFANLFFFMPLELGAREGGFALAVGGMQLSGFYGVFAALITRVREFIWIFIGIALMKVFNKKPQDAVD